MQEFVDSLKKYDLSCSGLYSSIGDKGCVFNWNTEKFPDPAKFVNSLEEKDIHFIPNIKPAFLLTHPMYDSIADRGFLSK